MKLLIVPCVMAFSLMGCGSAETNSNLSPRPPTQPRTLDVFVVAHPDDTELFMGKDAYDLINHSNSKKLFIVLTGGDANRKNTKAKNANITWWQAREQAHTLAINFWDNYQDTSTNTEVLVNQRYIQKITFGDNISLYNFRLWDYDQTTSLDALVKGTSTTIYDLKYNQSYQLNDIVKSIQDIINQEKNINRISIHITDDNHEHNPTDHKDHYATAEIMTKLYDSINIPCKDISKYLAYGFKNKPINLEGADKDRSFSLWNMMNDKLQSNGYQRNDDKIHMTLVGKQYLSYQQNTCPK